MTRSSHRFDGGGQSDESGYLQIAHNRYGSVEPMQRHLAWLEGECDRVEARLRLLLDDSLTGGG